MCIITDHSHVVRGRYLIRGTDPLPEGWHAYECFDTPVTDLPHVGDVFEPDHRAIIGGPRFSDRTSEIYFLEQKRLRYLEEVRRIENRLGRLRGLEFIEG